MGFLHDFLQGMFSACITLIKKTQARLLSLQARRSEREREREFAAHFSLGQALLGQARHRLFIVCLFGPYNEHDFITKNCLQFA